MNVVSRGIRNAFRNPVRTVAIVLILSLSIGLALSMLLARQTVDQKIQSVKNSIGNTIVISPAGVRGFEGGGNPLTTSQLAKLTDLPHVTKLSESLNDRLTSSDTNLTSSINPGQLGRRFAQRFNANNFSDSGSLNFSPPITVLGTTDPINLANTQGGGSFSLKAGKVFSSNSSADVALVGLNLATKNNLTAGSSFTAYGSTITVVGIFDSGNQFSNSLLIMPLSSLQNLSGQSGDVTSAIATVDSVDNLTSTTTAIQTALGTAADVTSSQTMAQNVIAPLENVKSIAAYSLIGAVVAGSVIILLTMVNIVRERRREIGVLKAIGASNIRVVWQFICEAVSFTIMAAVIGIVLGIFAGTPITNTLVNNSSTSSVSGPGTPRFGFRLGGGFRQSLNNLHASIGWNIIVFGLLAALIIAIVGSTVAAWFIAKIRPAEVMRTE
ncbi:MAG TPA: FtsX-like permease family protein [Candidatus Dormibacteraeota bacterium]|nr:FtsX-like permease family protein [Candidatus Dormibacteraeota bacterium]